MEHAKDEHLILIAVDQGYTDMVMDTAKRAGAKGGTIIRARWAGAEGIAHFYGITVQEEKEIIAIVTSGETRNAIMEAVNGEHGLKSEAHCVICSIGIEQTIRLG